MNRRDFIGTGLAMMGAAVIAGCTDDAAQDNKDNQSGGAFPSYDIPRYSDWIPEESHNSEATGVYFTHVDWESLDGLESESEDEVEDDEAADVIRQIPILGLPLYGALISPLTLFGIAFYPFAGDLLTEDGESAEGIKTTTLTWVDDLLIFHGEYDIDTFDAQYTDGFTNTEAQAGFTIYVGNEAATEGLAYALSEEALIVGMTPGETEEYESEQLITDALTRYTKENDRVVDTEDGQWLFETTGQAQMAFGSWETEDLMAALDTGSAENGSMHAGDGTSETELDDEANPVFDCVESVVNTISYSVDNGEMTDIEARFAGIYPEGSVPSEEEVREHLIGEADVPHEIIIDETHVHATATFEDEPGALA
ncbi:hypothetical protein [Natronosalvus caseinilyticus]|uniref:hypothetical protein n=1 Tax=Natronosalvus caseinilyticus TaxID=2953747 RepID=UPI0028AE8DEA|nr:hypothetical protein [Natronosalvus caseinilyticus]